VSKLKTTEYLSLHQQETIEVSRIYPSQFKLPSLAIPFFEGYIAKPEGGAKNIYTAHINKIEVLFNFLLGVYVF
jgi:hypothetical protein